MMQHCHMLCWFFLWLLWLTCLIPQNSENKPPLTISPHRLAHLLVNAWSVQHVSSFADKAPLSSSMNKPAESENEFVKTRVNEDYKRLFRHRKKVYLSFKKSLVIMEVEMMLLVSRDDDPYWITISDKFGLNLTLLCNICKEDQMKLFLFLITLNAYWCPRVPLSRPPQISLWKSQQSVASYTLTRTYITYKNNISARSLATFFNWVIHLRKK